MDIASLVIRVVLQVAEAILQAVQDDDLDALLKLRLDDILPHPLKSSLARAIARQKAQEKFEK